MNVVIVGCFWFPRGSASAARVRNLALGLKECGAKVHVIPLVPPVREWGRGVQDYLGVSYEHVAPTWAPSKGFRDEGKTLPRLGNGIPDKVRWFAGLYGAIPIAWFRLKERIDRGECDLVIVYDRSALRMTPLVRLCRARKVVSVLDVVEVSEHLRSRANAMYWDFAFGTRRTPRLFDGLTVITTGLERLYRVRGCSRTLLMPSIEEWPVRPDPGPTRRKVFQLTYVGALRPRDAPEMLLETIKILSQKGLPVSLDIIGPYQAAPEGRALAERCAKDPTLQGTVRFLGVLSDEALREHLQGSDGLVLTRRKARTEELSFPTRLVEYLSYARPVFVSAVGDVMRYLRDGVDAVFLDPGDPSQAASAISGVLASPDRGGAIGRAGRRAGARNFDRTMHARRLLEFAEELRE
jgi:glycosyltransferase involved in cell wall biosynthesis